MAKIRLMSQSRLTRIFREVGVDPAAAGGDLRKLQNLAHKENLLDRYDAIQAQKSGADSREFRKADAEMRKQAQPKQQLVLEQLWKTLDKNKVPAAAARIDCPGTCPRGTLGPCSPRLASGT